MLIIGFVNLRLALRETKQKYNLNKLNEVILKQSFAITTNYYYYKMLTRLQFGKRDFRFIVRCLSDKTSDNNGKTPDSQTEAKDVKKKSSESSTEKIQQLLKQMLAEPKISEKEYRANFATAPERPKRRKLGADDVETSTEKIEESLTKAAREVAQAIGDVKQTEAELLSKVLGKINQNSTTLSDLLIGMKVDRSKEGDDQTQRATTRGQQVKRFVDRPRDSAPQARYTQRKDAAEPKRPRNSAMPTNTINIFGGEPLGIFKAKEPNYGTRLDVWESLKQRELALATSQPPTNYFQKMVLWTEEGKVWKFPIDNEQGLEEEQTVDFSEHVFLESHLEGWCPKKGPIRHFMELVCVGLSKNAFYTAKEKKEHILWYKEYFESKKGLLTEVGAWEPKPVSSSETSSA